jgi:nucleotide-binding universal stress UspA family protein
MMISRILLATDGTPAAAGAVRTARLLHERDGLPVEVLSVYDPPMQFYGLEATRVVVGAPPHFGATAVEDLKERVTKQLEEVGGAAREWPVAIRLGPVAPTIARYAAESGAGLLLVGLRTHPPVDRWLARETLLRIIHLTHLPVLAVPAHLQVLFRRAVAGVDFSDLSRRALAELPGLLPAGADLYLLHTTWAPAAVEAWSTMDWVKGYRLSVEERLEEVAEELRGTGSFQLDLRVVEGTDPASDILALADQVDADLLVVGSHGLGYFGRIVLGSTAARLLHASHCALLVAPPAELPVELSAPRVQETLAPLH